MRWCNVRSAIIVDKEKRKMFTYTEEKKFTKEQVQQLFLSVNWISGKMIEYIKEKYKDFMYIDGMPEDKKNVPFYQKHGFSLMENGAAIQICNYENVQ